jgi:Skp family chaperone for outer membrane proteins
MGNQITEIHPAVEKYLQNLPDDFSDIPEENSLLKKEIKSSLSFSVKEAGSDNVNSNKSSEPDSFKTFLKEFRSDPRYQNFDHFFPNFAQWKFGLSNIEDALKKRKHLPKSPEMIWEQIDRLNYYANSPKMREKAYKGQEAGFLYTCFLQNKFQTDGYLTQSEIQKKEIEKWEEMYDELKVRIKEMEESRKYKQVLEQIAQLNTEKMDNLLSKLYIFDTTKSITEKRHLDQIIKWTEKNPNFWENL